MFFYPPLRAAGSGYSLTASSSTTRSSNDDALARGTVLRGGRGRAVKRVALASWALWTVHSMRSEDQVLDVVELPSEKRSSALWIFVKLFLDPYWSRSCPEESQVVERKRHISRLEQRCLPCSGSIRFWVAHLSNDRGQGMRRPLSSPFKPHWQDGAKPTSLQKDQRTEPLGGSGKACAFAGPNQRAIGNPRRTRAHDGFGRSAHGPETWRNFGFALRNVDFASG